MQILFLQQLLEIFQKCDKFCVTARQKAQGKKSKQIVE